MTHEPTKLPLSLVERHILSILEEAGDENLPTVVNTLSADLHEVSNDELLQLTESAVKSLVKAELVLLCQDFEKRGFHWVPIPLKVVPNSFRDVLWWHEHEGVWLWNEKRAGPHRINLVLTKKGERSLSGS